MAKQRRGDATLDHVTTAKLFAIANGTDDAAAAAAIALLDDLEDAQPEVTRETQDRIEGRWVRAMQHRGLEPWKPPNQIVAAWFDGLRETNGWAAIAVQARCLRSAFLRRGLPDPTADPLVVRTLAALRVNARTKTRAHEPLLVEDYLRVRRALKTSSLIDLRDRTAIGLSFHGALKPGQVLGLDVLDIAFEPQGVLVHVRRSGRSRRVEIARMAGDDVVGDLRDYLDRTGIVDGSLFRPLTGGKVAASRLTTKSLALALKTGLRRAGIDDRRYSWSGLRLGFIASAGLRNMDELELAIRAGFGSVRKLRQRLDALGSHGHLLLD